MPDSLMIVVFPLLAVDHAVRLRILRRDLFDADHRAVIVVEHLDHLRHHGRLAVQQVVREDHGERVVADQLLRAQHRVAEAERFGLTHVEAVDMARLDAAHEFEQLLLAARFEFGFDLVGLVEVVFDRALAAARDEDHFGDAGRHRFFDRVLDQRLVDDRQHLLRACLGRGEEPGAETCYRKNRFCNF